jgi:hypothetical protein
MKRTILFTTVLVFMSSFAFSQYEYEVSKKFPYGKANPEAPEQIKDYELMIGKCNCKSISRKQDGSWNDAIDMVWRWKYIMNGMAVQDETLKADGKHSGSIRQFSVDSSKWYVHYYASNAPISKLPVWEGTKKENGTIVHYKDHKAPNGTEGFYRLTFYDISKSGYKWVGEWVDKTETVVYPTWKIECVRKTKKN